MDKYLFIHESGKELTCELVYSEELNMYGLKFENDNEIHFLEYYANDVLIEVGRQGHRIYRL